MVANIIVFASGSGSNFRALVESERSRSDSPFIVRGLFCDRKCSAMGIAEMFGVPVLYLSMVRFLRERGGAEGDSTGRVAYDREVVTLLQDFSGQHCASIDLVVLAGYMRIVHQPLLDAYPRRILNIHPADLRAVDDGGRRRFVGADPVYDALVAGETRTRSTVMTVDSEVDTGPIVVEGPWVDYVGGQPVTRQSAAVHQARQKEESDWLALIEAVEGMTQDLKTDGEWRCVESSVSSVTNR